MANRGWQPRLPPGWLDCPNYGRVIRTVPNSYLKIVPSKVPLGPDFFPLIPPHKRYTLRMAVDSISREFGPVNLVIDLTNSYRYYNFGEEFSNAEAAHRQILYVKVPCRGRGQTPTPDSVNQVVYEVQRMLTYLPTAVIMMHCTHGFNRTGYMIVNVMTRLRAHEGMSVERSLRRFREAREPGIYKDGYINELFKYHHERRPEGLATPPVPAWKGEGDEDDIEEIVPEQEDTGPKEVRHERIEDIGEPIVEEEADLIRKMVYGMLTGQEMHEIRRLHFPGSQPVSLARANLGLLQMQRYWVSWKADGTRYLLLVIDRGCYLVDRSFKVVRLQMRFPKPGHPPHGNKPADYPVSRPHNATLLDGEMVVDETENGKFRRYLIYDMAVLNGKPLLQDKWLSRFMAVKQHVIDPRQKEYLYISGQVPRSKYLNPPLEYDYNSEPFSVRLKDFWPLFRGRQVIFDMIPKLSHEADGLILQSCDSGYVANTDNALLKFKFAHLNSVDFHIKVSNRAGQLEYALMVMDTGARRGPSGMGPPLKQVATGLILPEDPPMDGMSLHDRIVECTWVPERHSWKFLRVREDKDKPNASHVYAKVVESIEDDIREEELITYLEKVYYNLPPYEKDRQMMEDRHRPPHPPSPPPPADEYGRLILAPPPSHQHHVHTNYQERNKKQGPGACRLSCGHPGAPGAPAGGGPHAHGQPPHGDLNAPGAWDAYAASAQGTDGGQAAGYFCPPGWMPRSPPYYGPEPTPPHSPSQPVHPGMWTVHDPSTYPPEFLPPPPPPMDAQHGWEGQQGEGDPAGHPQHADHMGHHADAGGAGGGGEPWWGAEDMGGPPPLDQDDPSRYDRSHDSGLHEQYNMGAQRYSPTAPRGGASQQQPKGAGLEHSNRTAGGGTGGGGDGGPDLPLDPYYVDDSDTEAAGGVGGGVNGAGHSAHALAQGSRTRLLPLEGTSGQQNGGGQLGTSSQKHPDDPPSAAAAGGSTGQGAQPGGGGQGLSNGSSPAPVGGVPIVRGSKKRKNGNTAAAGEEGGGGPVAKKKPVAYKDEFDDL